MYESRRRRRSRRGGGSLSPALLGGRSRRNRRGGSHFPLSPANVSSLSPNADKYISSRGIDGAGITGSNGQSGVMTQALTAGYRRRRSRRDRR
jgi:hypothetical protein